MWSNLNQFTDKARIGLSTLSILRWNNFKMYISGKRSSNEPQLHDKNVHFRVHDWHWTQLRAAGRCGFDNVVREFINFSTAKEKLFLFGCRTTNCFQENIFVTQRQRRRLVHFAPALFHVCLRVPTVARVITFVIFYLPSLFIFSIFNAVEPPPLIFFTFCAPKNSFLFLLRVTNYGGMERRPSFFRKKSTRLLSICLLFAIRSEEPATAKRSPPKSHWRRSTTRIIASRYRLISPFSRRTRMKSSTRMAWCRAATPTTASSSRHNPMIWIRDWSKLNSICQEVETSSSRSRMNSLRTRERS